MTRNLLVRNWRLFSLVTGFILFFWLVYIWRSVFFPFVLGMVLGYLLMPAILWAEKRLPHPERFPPLKRISLILVLFALITGLIASLSYYIATTIVQSWTGLLHNAPALLSEALEQLHYWYMDVRSQMPPEMHQQMEQSLQDIGDTIGRAARDTLMRGVSTIPSTVGTILSMAALPMFLFFILKDWEKLGRSFYAALPGSINHHTRKIVSIIEDVLLRYIRAQAVLGFVVGVMIFIGLMILRVEFAVVLAIFAAATEGIPTIGPILAGTVAAVVALATAPDKVVWVILLFLVVQLLENNLLEPRIQGAFMRIHPAVAIVMLVLGAYLAGFWGMLLAIPLTATLVEIFRYVHQQIEANDDRREPHHTEPGRAPRE